MCGETFTPKRQIQPYCSINCEIERKKIKEKQIVKKESKSKSPMKPFKFLELEINKMVRLIDFGTKCISCNNKGIQAGHFYSVGSNSTLRYNLLNIHIQCEKCNGELNSNRDEYIKGLIQTYGLDYYNQVVELESKYKFLGLMSSEIVEITKLAKQINDNLESGIYSPKERIKLRNDLNLLLGIYK